MNKSLVNPRLLGDRQLLLEQQVVEGAPAHVDADADDVRAALRVAHLAGLRPVFPSVDKYVLNSSE